MYYRNDQSLFLHFANVVCFSVLLYVCHFVDKIGVPYNDPAWLLNKGRQIRYVFIGNCKVMDELRCKHSMLDAMDAKLSLNNEL